MAGSIRTISRVPTAMRCPLFRLALVASAGLLIRLRGAPAPLFTAVAVPPPSRSVDDRGGLSRSVHRGGWEARHRPVGLGNGLALVLTVPPADTSGATVTVLEGQGHDDRTRHVPVGAGPRVADSWDAWMQVPRGESRGKDHPETPDWRASRDGRTRTPPTRPPGAAFALEEGPYIRTKEPWEAFRMTIQYRALDWRPVTPRPPPFPHTNLDWSDSGVYIFDRYEVQILDPSRFDGPEDPPGGVPTGGEIRDDPRVRRGGRVVPNNRNRQVPGGVYGVDPPSGVYINRANPTGEWRGSTGATEAPEGPSTAVAAARRRTVARTMARVELPVGETWRSSSFRSRRRLLDPTTSRPGRTACGSRSNWPTRSAESRRSA